MSTYPVTIRRWQHIKVNGIQCGSPAKRNERHCFFHNQCRLMSREINMKFSEHGIIKLPTLEDANSIQLGLAEVMRLLVTQQIDHRTASLLLRALRTAAANVKFTSPEPKPTHIVIDPNCVENRPLGATAWSTVEGRDYDLVDDGADTGHADKNEDKPDQEGRRFMSELMRTERRRSPRSKFSRPAPTQLSGCARNPERPALFREPRTKTRELGPENRL